MIWIRSQDKKSLTYCKNLAVQKGYSGTWIIIEYHHTIEDVGQITTFLGEYNTEEDAISVLDDIETRVKSTLKDTQINPIFRMPQR